LTLIAIIGAGFGGLASAYKLAQGGSDVTVFEADTKPGGLAIGFKEPKWKWTIEKHYHHLFYSDWAIRNLAEEIGQELIYLQPKTSTYYHGKIYQLDTPMSLMKFTALPLRERIRTGAVIAYLKMIRDWEKLEKITAKSFLTKYMGNTSWKVLWQPLFEKKFGNYADEISAAWFWTRINKRSSSLGYPKGGFLAFAERLDTVIRKNDGKIFYNTSVYKISEENGKITITTGNGKYEFDKVICTLPTPLFLKMAVDLPINYKAKLSPLKGLGAINMVISLKHQFLEDGTYWLNINDLNFPFLAVVEHTNYMNKEYYDNAHLMYIGNYLPHNHDYFQKTDDELFGIFYPYLNKINPKFRKSWINNIYVFKTPFAQPILPLNYSKSIPPFVTPIQGLYLSNIQQVYPWDRGTNYAVENGLEVAKLIIHD